MLPLILPVVVPLITYFLRSLPSRVVSELLFGGRITQRQRTTFVFKETVERYKTSIKDVNRSLTLIIGFTVIALYAYLVLPSSGEVEIPFVALKVSRQLWIRIAPAIAYGLQVFGFTALIWFMLLRLGLRVLLSERTEKADEYGDITNIELDGALGHLWIILQIKRFYRSKWNYLWYAPALAVVSAVFISPLAVCLFFIKKIFASGGLLLGAVYTGLFIPYVTFFLLLVSTVAILGLGETTVGIEEDLGKRIDLVRKLATLAGDDERGAREPETAK